MTDDRSDDELLRTVFELTGFQRDLLFTIIEMHRPSGQDIRSSLEKEMGREITHGRLYPNLDTLVNTGLVVKGEIDRRTNYYEASDEGENARAVYSEWMSQ
jgi:DNA-binding PadR family transcriptional regulator